MKRPALSSADELGRLREQLLELMASVSNKSVGEMREAADSASSEATILELGLTSAMGISLKGRVVRELEAELTTFQLLKQPLQQVIESIGARARPAQWFPSFAPLTLCGLCLHRCRAPGNCGCGHSGVATGRAIGCGFCQCT